jgi:enoyl-CoA hydratase
MDPMIDIHDDGDVRYLTLNRPRNMNALNSAVLQALAGHVANSEHDRVGCLVIRGAGDKAFCAGADLGEIEGLDVASAHAFIRRGHQTMNGIEDSAVPAIASVDGYALGGGFELMLACHLVVASTRSSFGLPEVNIGCMPGFGGTQRLMTAIGRAPAFHLLLSGERIDASQAWQLGLLSVPPVPPDELDGKVSGLAHRIASGSRPGIRNILEAGRRAARAAALEQEAALAAIAIASQDGQEGIRAFTEKRPPLYQQEPR